MAKGRMPMGMGGMNMNAMLKQAQKMQAEMERIKNELEAKEYEATAGGGAVKVVVTGKKEITAINIEPDVLGEENDVEMLADMIMIAANTALKTAAQDYESQMSRLTGGAMPGMF